MGKNKNKTRGQGEGAGAAASPAAAAKAPRTVKPFVERLIGKATDIHLKAVEIAKAAETRGAPAATVVIAKEFAGLAEKYRDAIAELQASGWKPSDSSIPLPITEGSKVSIKPENKGLYDYIPGVADGTARLVATKVIEHGMGRMVQALVATEEGTPCGYIPRSHLVLR